MAKEKDRHKAGYYKEYARRTGKKDRHKPGYYKEYQKRKAVREEKESKVKKLLDAIKKDFRWLQKNKLSKKSLRK